jgi:hypothetical protein
MLKHVPQPDNVIALIVTERKTLVAPLARRNTVAERLLDRAGGDIDAHRP